MKVYLLINSIFFNDYLDKFCKTEKYSFALYDDFFDSNFTNTIIAKKEENIIISIEYDINDVNINILKEFIVKAKETSKNIYYSPKPNKSVMVLNYALFSIVNIDAISHYFIEKLYKEHSLTLANRNKMHNSLRKSIDSTIPKLLTNLSNEWIEWSIDKKLLHYDLIKNIKNYYEAPDTIHVVVGNQCNLSCTMCPHHSKEIKNTHTTKYLDKKELMNIEIFDKIAKYAAKHASKIQFGQIEEPFLNSNLIEFIKIAKQYSVPSVHLTTNGTLLDSTNAKELANSGINSVMFSIDAATSELYKKVRGGDLRKLEKKIIFFLSLIKDKDIYVTVSFILQGTSPLEKESFIKKWKEYGVDSVTCYNLSEYDDKGDVSREDNMYERGERYPCASPWTMTAVMPNGDITMCCKTLGEIGWRDVESLGNISNNTFSEVWLGERYAKVREELLNNKFEIFKTCESCDIWSATNYFKKETDEYNITYNETTEVYVFK